MHNITPQYITLTLHHTYVQYITPTLHHTTPHHSTLHYPSLRDTIGHYTTLPATNMTTTTTTATTPRCATLQDATLHEPHFTTIHPIAVYQIRPHYTTLHHTIPHHTDHIELHCTTLATVTTTSSAIVPFWSEFVSICGMQVRISFYTHRIWKKISCRLEKQCSWIFPFHFHFLKESFLYTTWPPSMQTKLLDAFDVKPKRNILVDAFQKPSESHVGFGLFRMTNLPRKNTRKKIQEAAAFYKNICSSFALVN